MNLRSSSEYAAAIPDGHPVFTRIAELDRLVVAYDALTERQKQSPKGKLAEGQIRLIMRECDVMLFALFPELKAMDEQFDHLPKDEQTTFLDFAFDLWEKISDRGYAA